MVLATVGSSVLSPRCHCPSDNRTDGRPLAEVRRKAAFCIVAGIPRDLHQVAHAHTGGSAPGCRHVNPRLCTTVKASAYKGMTMCVLVSLVKNTRLPVASPPKASNFLHPLAPP